VKPISVALLAASLLAARLAGGTAGVVPAATCAPCHQQAKTQAASNMAKALERGADSSILKEHPQLAFTEGGFSYKIERVGDRSLYTVTDGKESLTVPIPWAFGLGAAGQTYVLELNGKWYESRVSFYQDIKGLDLTLGAAGMAPQNLTGALGREMTQHDVAACFACHSTNSVHGREVDFEHMVAGVLCENCHGSAATHVEGMKTGNLKAGAMPKLSRLSTEEMFEACGRCHRTWAAIATNGPRGIQNVRFQPYRLTNSKCYDAADQRISCVGCHDPHSHQTEPASFFEAKCVACHAANRTAHAKQCTVSKHDCVSCHMPKVEIPGSHHKFTDHEIRIARAGSPYPD
jgi:Cytochrome c3